MLVGLPFQVIGPATWIVDFERFLDKVEANRADPTTKANHTRETAVFKEWG